MSSTHRLKINLFFDLFYYLLPILGKLLHLFQDSSHYLIPKMPDLRRQIFESGKTVSRKAASREASRTNSPASSKPTSRQGSRNASRAPSDEEDSGFLSDETSMR